MELLNSSSLPISETPLSYEILLKLPFGKMELMYVLMSNLDDMRMSSSPMNSI
jgi:hypothetical protein